MFLVTKDSDSAYNVAYNLDHAFRIDLCLYQIHLCTIADKEGYCMGTIKFGTEENARAEFENIIKALARGDRVYRIGD